MSTDRWTLPLASPPSHPAAAAAHVGELSHLLGGVQRSYVLCDGGRVCDGGQCGHAGGADRSSPPAPEGGTMVAQTGAVVAAVSFTWLGMVLAISFLEAPLKFRAPGVTIPLGLGIGRLVFRALNRVELVLLVLTVVGVALAPRPTRVGIAAALAVLVAVQLGAVRPALNRRSDRVLAGEELPRSRGHLVYVALEVVKVALLVTLGTIALASGCAPAVY